MARQPRTLLWQLGAALMIVQCAVAVIFGIYGYIKLREFSYQQAEAALRQLCDIAAIQYRDLLDSGDADSLQARTLHDGADPDTRVTITALDGTVLADSDAVAAQMVNHADRPEIQQAIQSGSGSSIRTSSTIGAAMLYVAIRIDPADGGGAPLGVLRISRPLVEIHNKLNGFALSVGAGGLTLLVLTSLVLLLISRRFSRQVGEIAESARLFAEGQWTQRIRVPPTRELIVLAESLNEVGNQVSKYIIQLELQRNEQQAIVQSMSSGVIALDREQRVLSVNRAAERLLGLSGVRARRRLLQEIVRQPALNRFVDEAISSESGTIEEIRLDGAPQRMIEITSELLRGPSGEQVGLLVLLNDVTELRRLESIRTDFVANVSHELRTPITNIKGYVETMVSVGVEDRQQARQFLDVIRRNADRLAAIIDDLLSLARLEHPETKQTLEVSYLPVRRLVASVVSQYEQATAAKSIRIEIDTPENLSVRVAPHLAEQALGNLVSNAVKYSPPSTTVMISAAPADSGLVDISVADHGPGIDARHLSRIFERFYRIDKARSREMGGTGLGLAIVKHIALAHGGRVDVQSQLGKGSTFHLLLPRG